MITYYSDEKLEVAVFEQAKPGKSLSGDAYTVIQTKDYAICAVVDGLGSGEAAYQSAKAAIDMIQIYQDLNVDEIVYACNDALVNKRGAVLTVIKVNYLKQEVSYCNHGNIGFVMYQSDGTTVQPVPIRGYLSGKNQSVKTSSFPFYSGSAFALYSDGLKKRPDKDLLLQMETPRSEVESLFTKENYAVDDVTILIGKLY